MKSKKLLTRMAIIFIISILLPKSIAKAAWYIDMKSTTDKN